MPLNKICPLLTASSDKGIGFCIERNCAWWVDEKKRCAVCVAVTKEKDNA